MLSSRKVNVHDSDMNKLMAGSVQINKKATVLCIIGLAVVLYLLYSWRRTSVSDVVVDSVSSVSNNAWDSLPNQLPVPAEHQSLVDIPKDILNSQKEVRIKEEYLTFTLGDTVTKQSQKVTVFYQEAAPLHKRKTECSVLLLHGAKFTSQNWHEMNTLQLIAACGCRAVAVDLPGWGKSIKDVTKQSLDSRDKPVFLERLIATLELGKPVLVSPSMSGSFAIPFLMGDKPAQCGSRLKAFIALAPVQTENYEHSMYHRCEIPAMIVSGTKDMSIGRESLGNLRNMPSSKIFPIQKAGHACYIEQPHVWNRLLYNFLLFISLQ